MVQALPALILQGPALSANTGAGETACSRAGSYSPHKLRFHRLQKARLFFFFLIFLPGGRSRRGREETPSLPQRPSGISKFPPGRGQGPMTWGAPDHPHLPAGGGVQGAKAGAKCQPREGAARAAMPTTISSIWSMLGRKRPSAKPQHIPPGSPSSRRHTNAPSSGCLKGRAVRNKG